MTTYVDILEYICDYYMWSKGVVFFSRDINNVMVYTNEVCANEGMRP